MRIITFRYIQTIYRWRLRRVRTLDAAFQKPGFVALSWGTANTRSLPFSPLSRISCNCMFVILATISSNPSISCARAFCSRAFFGQLEARWPFSLQWKHRPSFRKVSMSISSGLRGLDGPAVAVYVVVVGGACVGARGVYGWDVLEVFVACMRLRLK